MLKYDLIPDQLIYEGIIDQGNLFSPDPIDEFWIQKTHDKDYWQKLKSKTLNKVEERRIGFPLIEELVNRERIIVNGTVLNSVFAIDNGISLNIAGGTHHAGYNWGEGFCLLNDIAIAANYLIENKLSKRVLILDLDVHQGNGTAQIFEKRDDVYTFSVHGDKNFPFRKEKSNLDVPLPDGVYDEEYLEIISKTIPEIINHFVPDFVFYQSGVDILDTDKLGKLNVSIEGCKQRDLIVFENIKKFGLPVAVSMGGGYSEKIKDIVDAHCNTFKMAFQVFDK